MLRRWDGVNLIFNQRELKALVYIKKLMLDVLMQETLYHQFSARLSAITLILGCQTITN